MYSPQKFQSFCKKANKKSNNLLKTHTNIFYFKNSSIESIHRTRKKKMFLQQSCPLQILNKHFKNSIHETKQEKQLTKKQAYNFFNNQRKKQNQVTKQQSYLLPKIYKKSKKNCNLTVNSSLVLMELQSLDRQKFDMVDKRIVNQNKKNLTQKKQKQKGKLKKQNENKISQNEKQQNQVKQKVSLFKQKCQKSLQKITLKLPTKQDFFQKRRFFDLSQKDLLELYNEKTEDYFNLLDFSQNNKQLANVKDLLRGMDLNISKKIIKNQNNYEQENINCRNFNKNMKFKQLILQQQNQNKQKNSSIPKFLLQRITTRKHLSQHDLSFVTQNLVGKIPIDPLKRKAKKQRNKEHNNSSSVKNLKLI